MDQEPYTRASEIGTFVFCRRAWLLAQRGAPSALEAERATGVAFHNQHAVQMAAAERAATEQIGARSFTSKLLIAAALVLLLIGLALVLL